MAESAAAAAQTIKPFKALTTNDPRPALGPARKRKLEKQFAREVPEFSGYFKRKRRLEDFTIVSSLSFATLVGVRIFARGSNTLGALVGALGTFATTAIALRFPIGPQLFGLNKYNKHECERAFNLWVYYEHNPTRLAGVNVNNAKQLYEQGLAQFKKSYKRANFDPKQ